MPAEQLRARRRALAERLGDVEHVLAGLAGRAVAPVRAAGLPVRGGEPHGPYAYFTPRPGGRGRAGTCRRHWRTRAPLPAARRGSRGGAGGDLGNQRRAAGAEGTGVAGGRRRADRGPRGPRPWRRVAGMTSCALGGRLSERRAQDHRQAPGEGRPCLPAPVDPGPGPRAHRVDDAAVCPGGHRGRAGLGTAGRGGDRPDLGLSGTSAAHRQGFRDLCRGSAWARSGRCFGLEVSRLARSNADLARLAEMARLTGTLLIDSDGVYDLSTSTTGWCWA